MTVINLGAHVSIAHSIDLAVERAYNLGAESIQIFPAPPRTWITPQYPADKLVTFNKNIKKYKIRNVFLHGIYLSNLGSRDKNIYNKSFSSTLFAAKLSKQLNSSGLIIHPGSSKGWNTSKSIQQIGSAIHNIIDETDANIIFENTAGAGDTIGQSFLELNSLINKVNKPHNIGICLDTCHLNSSIYALSSISSIDKIIEDFDNQIGLNYLKVIHLNNSAYPANSRKDIHADIESGSIPVEMIHYFVHHPKIRHLPFVLETPVLKNQLLELGGRDDISHRIVDKVRNILT